MKTIKGEAKEVEIRLVKRFGNFDLVDVYCLDKKKFLYRTCINTHEQGGGFHDGK